MGFPFKMARTNNPWNYGFTSKNEWTGHRSVIHRSDSVHYGLLGAAISSTDRKLNLSFDYKGDNEKLPIDHIRVYHNKGELAYNIKYDPIKIQSFINLPMNNLDSLILILRKNSPLLMLNLSRRTTA